MASSSSGPPLPAGDTFTPEMRDRAARGLDPYGSDDDATYDGLSSDEAVPPPGPARHPRPGAQGARPPQQSATRRYGSLDGNGKISLRSGPCVVSSLYRFPDSFFAVLSLPPPFRPVGLELPGCALYWTGGAGDMSRRAGRRSLVRRAPREKDPGS